MWLYLNRKVVLQVFNDEADSTKLCKRLNISQASEAGLYNILLLLSTPSPPQLLLPGYQKSFRLKRITVTSDHSQSTEEPVLLSQ